MYKEIKPNKKNPVNTDFFIIENYILQNNKFTNPLF